MPHISAYLPIFHLFIYLLYVPANASVCDASSEGVDSDLSRYRYMFIVAQLLHGAGSAPLYTIGVTYLDDNLKAKQTSLYAGVYLDIDI